MKTFNITVSINTSSKKELESSDCGGGRILRLYVVEANTKEEAIEIGHDLMCEDTTGCHSAETYDWDERHYFSATEQRT